MGALLIWPFTARMRKVAYEGKDDAVINKLVDTVVSFPVLAAVKAMIAHRAKDPAWAKMRAPLDTLDEFFGVTPAEDGYETVGGLLSGISGQVPAAGTTLYHSGLQFDVEKADDRRVLAVRVRRPGIQEIPIG